MKYLSQLPTWLRNKYFISLAAFATIILFLDKNDLFTQYQRQKDLRKLQQSKRHYTAELAAERKQLEALERNPATVGKLAREKYLMKRDNEELFIVSEKPDTKEHAAKN